MKPPENVTETAQEDLSRKSYVKAHIFGIVDIFVCLERKDV